MRILNELCAVRKIYTRSKRDMRGENGLYALKSKYARLRYHIKNKFSCIFYKKKVNLNGGGMCGATVE